MAANPVRLLEKGGVQEIVGIEIGKRGDEVISRRQVAQAPSPVGADAYRRCMRRARGRHSGAVLGEHGDEVRWRCLPGRGDERAGERRLTESLNVSTAPVTFGPAGISSGTSSTSRPLTTA